MNTEVPTPNKVLNNDDLNESDSEFLSELDQAFATSITAKPPENSKIKKPPAEIIATDNTPLSPQTSVDPPRIETFLHTHSVKKNLESPTIENAPASESTPVVTNTKPIPNTENWQTITLWFATVSLITAGIAIWQINELYEYTFRLEMMNKTLETKLLETLTRIDLIKDNFSQLKP